MSNTLILDPTRLALASRLAAARTATDELFSIVRPEALYDRPIPERHRLIFYLGQEIANAPDRPKWNPESYKQIVEEE